MSGMSLGSALISSHSSAPIKQDLRVKRGLGILEDMIKEKNPHYFKNLQGRMTLGLPTGMPISELNKRLSTQVRNF